MLVSGRVFPLHKNMKNSIVLVQTVHQILCAPFVSHYVFINHIISSQRPYFWKTPRNTLRNTTSQCLLSHFQVSTPKTKNKKGRRIESSAPVPSIFRGKVTGKNFGGVFFLKSFFLHFFPAFFFDLKTHPFCRSPRNVAARPWPLLED